MSVLAESLSAREHESGKSDAARLPNRIEIKTLVQPLGHAAEANDRHDQALADLINLDWEILNIAVTSHEAYTATIFHTRVVTLKRLVEAPEPPAEQARQEGAAEVVKDETAATVETAEVVAIGSVPDSWREMTPAELSGVALPLGAIERPPLDDVAYGWACMCGLYSPDELREIGLREALHAGITATWARQESNGVTWESLLNRLPVSQS